MTSDSCSCATPRPTGQYYGRGSNRAESCRCGRLIYGPPPAKVPQMPLSDARVRKYVLRVLTAKRNATNTELRRELWRIGPYGASQSHFAAIVAGVRDELQISPDRGRARQAGSVKPCAHCGGDCVRRLGEGVSAWEQRQYCCQGCAIAARTGGSDG